VGRAVARAPIRVYGAGYGFLFGARVLLLEHTGRVSGLPRYVVVEVPATPGASRKCGTAAHRQ